MSKMSDWAMDLEDATVEALNNGAECEADVIAYVKTKVAVVDEKYVSDLYTEWRLFKRGSFLWRLDE